MGIVTFVDAAKVRHKRDPGRCYRKAGFKPARCPSHGYAGDELDAMCAVPQSLDAVVRKCAACHSRTKRGLIAWQLLPEDMPAAEAPHGGQITLLAG